MNSLKKGYRKKTNKIKRVRRQSIGNQCLNSLKKRNENYLGRRKISLTRFDFKKKSSKTNYKLILSSMKRLTIKNNCDLKANLTERITNLSKINLKLFRFF